MTLPTGPAMAPEVRVNALCTGLTPRAGSSTVSGEEA